MKKAHDYKIADTNLANFGTDLEKSIKKASGECEPAWKGAGKAAGLQIWRVEKFEIKKWEEHGEFFSNDSYIVLHTYVKEGGDSLEHDIHFWLGETTTADEAGTAAYKSVELDTVLDGKPTIWREVEDHESHLFLTYFEKFGGIQILEGGIESGFTHVTPEEYRPRLLHLKGKRNIRVREVPLSYKSLNSGDAFLLDNGLVLYQWMGLSTGIKERGRIAHLVAALDTERKGKPEVVVLREGETGSEMAAFWKALGGEGEIASAESGGCDAKWESEHDKKLYRLAITGDTEEFTLVSEGKITKDLFHSDDAFIFDVGCEVICWIGAKASSAERSKSLKYAQDYLVQNDRPHWLPISRVLEGGENAYFNTHLD